MKCLRVVAAVVLLCAISVPALPQGRRRAISPRAVTDAEVRRFLAHCTFGPTEALVEHVKKIGFDSFIEQQFNARVSGYPDVPTQRSIPGPDCDAQCRRDRYSAYPLQRVFFTNALYGEDQLRQRVAWALHKILVISATTINEPKAFAPYLQIIDRNAFGNYRQLLYEMTLNPAMGAYLNMVTSTASNPNENYAREILQLFSVGTVMLDADGRARVDASGNLVATYDQAVVDGFTRALTGWTWTPKRAGEDRNDFDPMIPGNGTHDTGNKLLLGGAVLPAAQSAEKDLQAALDNIFNHPNVGPFLARQLIQSLVASNPSPEYVGRVARAFDDNGRHVRGDLKAVVKAILLDPEARRAPADGAVREPVLFITNILRAFAAQSDGYLNDESAAMGQDVFNPPSVFGYYSPDFLAPGTTDLASPEFEIISASTLVARINFVDRIVFRGIEVSANAPTGTALDFSPYVQRAGNAEALVEELTRVLLPGRASLELKRIVIRAVEAVPASDPLARVRQAVYLICSSGQFQVMR